MRAPTGLVATALALWGWSVGHLALGLVLGAAYEVSHVASPSPAVAARLPLVMRACGLAVLVLLGYVIATQSLPHSLYTWLRWLPVVLLPVAALGQLAGGVRESHLRHALGRAPGERESNQEIDVTHAYAALALGAAGTGNGAHPWLYSGYALVVGWALLARQPRRRLLAATVMFVGAAAFGHAIHTSIWLLQGQVEEWSTELLHDLFTPKANPFKERTRIGDLGRIKLSDRILMRVEVEGARPASLLLRETAFELYRGGEWRVVRPTGRPVENAGDRWTLSQGPAPRRLAVRRSLPGGEGVLPLPAGARTVESLPAQSLEVFPTGTVRVHGSPRFLAFTAAYDPAGERDAPSRADLDVPGSLSDVLDRTIAANRLRRAAPAQTVEAVRAFFDANFAYSLDLGESTRTLADFLVRDRKGHCEYFASSTAMLLRALGIPARYAAGYSVQEYSNLERAFVVRNRHAHAWVTAWVDGHWIEVDTTPARWAELEGEAVRGFFAPFLDGFSWLFEQVIQAWIDLGDEGLALVAKWAAGIVLAAGVIWAIGRLGRKTRGLGGRSPRDAIARAWAGVEKRLARRGFRRGEAETVREWMRRLASDPAAPWAASLAVLATNYYRARFDPAAGEEEIARFVDSARRWRLDAGPS
jgi:transglutaminase-like putative cysteine protease